MSVGPGEAFNNLFAQTPSHGHVSVAPAEPEAWLIVDDKASAAHDHPAGSFNKPFVPQTWDEAHALPSGAHFYDPAGILRIRD